MMFRKGDKVKNKYFKGYVFENEVSGELLKVIITHNPEHRWTDSRDWSNGQSCWRGDYGWKRDEVTNWKGEFDE